MQKINPYDFFLEVRDLGTAESRHEKFEDDTIALIIEDAMFSAVCEGEFPAVFKIDKAIIEPAWKEEGLSPYMTGINVTISAGGEDGERSYCKQYDKSPFHTKARQVVAELVNEDLRASDRYPSIQTAADKDYVWMVAAFRKPEPSVDPAPKRFSTEAPDHTFPILKRSPNEFDLTIPDGSPFSYAVFVPSEVIREIRELTLNTNGQLEQAGVLIGHLAQDPSTGQVFSVVTAHIEATVNVKAEMDSFKFTTETFMEIQKRIQLRRSGEIVLGWQHNHHYCPGCPSNPSGATIFFSSADVKVQCAAFRPPYMVALVSGRDLNLELERPAVSMFGWRNADIRPRNFLGT